MNEISNFATSVGNYNNVQTSLTSNTSVVSIVDGLTLTMNADKQKWVSGNLTYTIVLDNQTDLPYESPVITDEIDTSLVDFVNDSVTINSVKATEDQFDYDSSSGILTINLDEVAVSGNKTITFSVKKK